jgi:hypothetical protein
VTAPVAPMAPATSASPYAPPPPAFAPSAVPHGSPAPESEGQVLVLTAQRLEPSTPTATPPMVPVSKGPFAVKGRNLSFGVTFVLVGVFSILGGVCDWDFFMNSRKARIWVWLFGREGARWFYVLFGLGIIVFGLQVVFGFIEPEIVESFRRRRY